MHARSEARRYTGHITRFGPRAAESKFGFTIFSYRCACYSNVVDMQLHSRTARLREQRRCPAIIETIGSTNHRSGTPARIDDGRVRG